MLVYIPALRNSHFGDFTKCLVFYSYPAELVVLMIDVSCLSVWMCVIFFFQIATSPTVFL